MKLFTKEIRCALYQYNIEHLSRIESSWWTKERCEKALLMVWSSPSLLPIQLVLSHHPYVPTPLFLTAIKHGRMEHVKIAIRCQDLLQGIHRAIQFRQHEVVRYLLQYESLWDTSDTVCWLSSRDIVCWLASQGDILSLERLKRLESITANGYLLIFDSACRYAQTEVVKWVMKHTEIDFKKHGSSFLRSTCMNGTVVFLEWIVPFVTEYDPVRMLAQACRYGSIDIAKWWLEHHVIPDVTCFQWAIESGHFHIISLIWKYSSCDDEYARLACETPCAIHIAQWILIQPNFNLHHIPLLYRSIRDTSLRQWMVERFRMVPYVMVGTNRLYQPRGYYLLPYDVRKYIATFLVGTAPHASETVL